MFSGISNFSIEQPSITFNLDFVFRVNDLEHVLNFDLFQSDEPSDSASRRI